MTAPYAHHVEDSVRESATRVADSIAVYLLAEYLGPEGTPGLTSGS